MTIAEETIKTTAPSSLERQLQAQTALCNKLMASDRMWAATVDTLPDAVYMFSSDKRLTRINRAGETLEQAGRSFLVGRRCCDMLWGLEGSECMVDRALANGKPVEVEIPEGGKVPRPLLVRVIPLNPRQHKDGAAGCIVVVRDISELRHAEAEVSKNRAFLASLVDLAPAEIYTLDSRQFFTWVNKRAEIDTGFTPSVLLDQDFCMFVAAESKDEANLMMRRALAGEESQSEISTMCADGRVRCMDAHASPLWHDGSITGVLVFMSDITERKLARERAARSDKLRALGELAAGVAHNLNNSFTVIQGRAQLLLMRSADDSSKKSLELITQAVADCSQTLRRLLDFSRRDSTRAFLPVDLTELIASSVEIARPKWQAESPTRTGTIEVRVEASGPVLAPGDSAELREVILNMLFNAVDAMPQGGTIEAGTRADGKTARFWVADTGGGMAPDVIARIFEPFYTTKGERGTGLGLSASHGIIENHGGHINVTSELGKGTRFEVALPLHETPAQEATPSAESAVLETKPARVLVVEDEEKIRTLLQEAFCAAGHKVTEAANGAEAIKRLDDGEFDLMICDLGLPELSGLHVARWVKEFRPDLPVIIATGFAEMITKEDHDKARIDDVIRKPYAVADVLNRANQIIAAQSNGKRETVVLGPI
jgi:PAS domain S-box-containing protein